MAKFSILRQQFGKMVKLVSFVPFKDAAHALEVINDVSEGAAAVSFVRVFLLEGRFLGVGWRCKIGEEKNEGWEETALWGLEGCGYEKMVL